MSNEYDSLLAEPPADQKSPYDVLLAQPSPTPQGQIERGNIDVSNRPVVQNQDGSVSTVKTIGVGTDKGEAVIPTVVNGKVVSNQEAIQHFKDTGEHLGVFDTTQNADAFATDLHNREAQRVQAPSQSREATRPTVSLPNLTASIFGETAGQTVQHAQEAGMDIVRGIPGMVESLPKTAYQGLKFAAGGPQEKAQVIEQVAAEALPQGRQIASDVQFPLGSRESFRGLASLGMLAIPSLTEAIFGRATPEIPIETEKPPIQNEAPPVQASRFPLPAPLEGEQPVQSGSVRLYHGASEGAEQAGSDFTPIRSYAQGYADKAVGGGKLWYVDVPEGTVKTHDEYGQPMSRVVVPDEISSKALPVSSAEQPSSTLGQPKEAEQVADTGARPVSAVEQTTINEGQTTYERSNESVNRSGVVSGSGVGRDEYRGLRSEPEGGAGSVAGLTQGKEAPSIASKWYNASHKEISGLEPRPIKSVDSIGTWVTSNPALAKTLYGPKVHGVEVGNPNLLEFDGTDPQTTDLNRTLGANTRLARETGHAKEAAILDKTLPDTRRLSDLTKKLNAEEGLTANENVERQTLQKAEQASRTLLNDPKYNQAFRKMLQDQGYEGIVWKNSRIDTRAGDPSHDVAVIFHDKPLSIEQAAQPKEQNGPISSDHTIKFGNSGNVLRQHTEALTDAGPKPAVPVSTEGEATVALGNTKEITPTAETPTTSGEIAPQGQAAPQSITSIKNKQVDAERETRGLPPVVEPARKAFGESWEQATQKIDDNPGYPDQLIDELKSKPRALSDVEDATLLHRQVDLQNQYQKSADLLIRARESGDEVGAMEHDARVNALSDQLLELYDVGKKAGTETGRGLAARKLLAAEDFSLANMVTQKRAANQGAALTPEQTAEVSAASEKISAAKTAHDEYEASPRAEAYKKRLQTLTGQYKERTAKGDFAPRKRNPIILDKEGEQLKANLERAKKDWLTALQKDRAANRTPSQKFWDRFVGVERAMKLSSDVVLAKLTTAAAVREAGLTPLEEAAGAGIGKVLPGLAKRAPREGGFSPAAEIKAKAEMFTSGMKDAWRNLKMQQSDLDTLYSSKKPPPPSEFYDYLGYLHGALKAPVKRAEFARSLTKRMEWAVKNGQDLNNVNTMRALSEQAYVDANRSIFMQDNVVASSFTNALRMAEKSKVAPNLGPAIARIGRFLVPIVKIPTNIVGEVATGVHGLATGGARAAVAYLKGIDKLPTEQADSIMRQLKKGAIGNSLILAGYYGANNIGGFYHDKDKRTTSDVQPGRYRVGDVDLPASAGHSTGAMLLNIGATVKRVQDERIRKTDSQTKGLAEGVRAAGAGLAHEIPFVPAATGITDALGSPNGFEKYVNGMIQSTTVPALSSHIAKILDTPGSLPSNLLDEPVKRKPTNPLEAVKMGIPGLRQTVPERPEKGTKHKKVKTPTGEDTTPLN